MPALFLFFAREKPGPLSSLGYLFPFVHFVIARNEVTKQSRFREIAADCVLANFGIAAPRKARLAMTVFG